MNNDLLHILFSIRGQLQYPKFDQGELSGKISITPEVLSMLGDLSEENIVEDSLNIDGKTLPLKKISPQLLPKISDVIIFTKNLPNARYYESFNDFITKNLASKPNVEFGIYRINYISTGSIKPEKYRNYETILSFISILESLSDYVDHDVDGSKELIFFHKKKLSFPINYNETDLRDIPYLPQLKEQLESAHDKDERVSIFKSELITSLIDVPVESRFQNLLATLNSLYDNYLKSHLLYLEKFSYHDLKTEVDRDKLDFTKKIYAVVNDIQSKLIAVPAAYLLVLSQFDFTGQSKWKNLLISIGSILFAVLLETLLSNQFGVLKFIKSEIEHFKNELSNKDTKINLSDFVNSFGDLNRTMRRQRIYLWIFRVITWLVPITSVFMFFKFKT